MTRTTTMSASCTLREEIANSIIHGVGAVLAIGGLAVLVAFAALRGDAWHIVSVSVFGAALVILYTVSTLYHAVQHDRVKSILQIIDHSAIFVLIAGTYTPFMLVNMRGPLGWTILGGVWAMAVFGIAFKITMLHKWASLSLPLYLAMGWIGLLALKPMFATTAPGGLTLLLLGGLAYTFGAIFFVWERLPYNHAVWHVFVLLGSAAHYFAVLHFVIPQASVPFL